MSEKLRVERTRDYKPYAELSHANYCLLENLREQRSGWVHEAMACLIVSAFRFEGILNQVGEEVVHGWRFVERTSVKSKAEFLAKQVGLELDWGNRPLQTIGELLKARNDLAHAKPELLETDTIESGDREAMRRAQPQVSWEKLCTLEFAEKADEDTEAFAVLLAEAAGLDPRRLRASSHSYTIGKP